MENLIFATALLLGTLLLIALPLALVLSVSTREGCVGVLTAFGRFNRLTLPGMSPRWPWEQVRPLSRQNRSMDLEFEAITVDQANVYFKCMLLYRVAAADEATIRRAAFAFATPEEFQLSMQRLLEDETRTYVSTQRQAEMIGISQVVVHRIKERVGARLLEWGYTIEDLRYHSIRFDEVITKSMARVVAAINERDAAKNEGEALLIKGGIGSMQLPDFITQQRSAIDALCQRLHVRRLDLFGSAVRPDFDTKRSDLDFVVAFDELPPVEYADAFFALKEGRGR